MQLNCSSVLTDFDLSPAEQGYKSSWCNWSTPATEVDSRESFKTFHVHLSVKNTPFVLDKHTAEIELKRSDSYLDLFTAVPLRKCQNCHLVPQPFTQSRDKKQHHHGAGLMCLSKMTIHLAHQMDRSLNPLNLSHVTIWLGESVSLPFGKGKQNLGGDWKNLLSMTFKPTNQTCYCMFSQGVKAQCFLLAWWATSAARHCPVASHYEPRCLPELLTNSVRTRTKSSYPLRKAFTVVFMSFF